MTLGVILQAILSDVFDYSMGDDDDRSLSDDDCYWQCRR